MDKPVAHALDFVRNFAALAERLAQRNIAVRCLHYDWSAFGSWTVDASRGDAEAKRSSAVQRHAFSEAGPEVCRVEWDGKDRQLSMRSTPTQATVMMTLTQLRLSSAGPQVIEGARGHEGTRRDNSRRTFQPDEISMRFKGEYFFGTH